MKILIVSATYPPASSATAGILKNLVEHFKASGCEVDALTVKSHMAEPFAEKSENSNLYRANFAMYDQSTSLSLRDVVFKIKRRLRVKINKIKKISAELYNEGMVRALLGAMKKIDMQAYDAIISVCAYYSAAEAVMRYKEKYGLRGKTVLYQVDPLADNMAYSGVPQQIRSGFEDRLFSGNDVIITTPLIYSGCKNQKYKDKMVPVEFPYINITEGNACTPIFKKGKEIIFVFAGYIYPTIRNPKFMLELFSKLQDLDFKLYMIGSGMEDMLHAYAEGALRGKLICLGRQPSEVCDEWFEKADVLVNISNAVPNQVPSKVFQYISYGKPILNVYKLKESPCLAYLGDYPLAVNVFEGNENNEALAAETLEKLRSVIGNRVSPEQITAQYKHCTPEYVAGQILDAIRTSKE